ncbi:MAG: hypothetical protein SCALA702_14080 [Melioribacteraceae bacterium]|nr:MAG: hypothetical protein SCALA702_14080 [Melioribacteraceae bacterium]
MRKNASSKKLIFTVFTVLIPIVFFVILELLLVTFDIFPQQPLFMEDGKVVRVNSNVGERYFNKNIMPVPNIYPQEFEAEKSENTFRIFCLGGSTTAGFPYEMTVPFPKQLELILEEDYPDRKFEVINLGLSAVNSFTVLDWIPDVLEHEPDLIIIYMGHNEFYGAYGTGSTISVGNSGGFIRFVLELRKFRVTQMIIALLNQFSGKADDADKTTVMEKVVADQFIAADSDLRAVTLENFSENLEIIINKLNENNVPLIVSNLVSNLKDQPPLDSYNMDKADSTNSSKIFRLAVDMLTKGDSLRAYSLFRLARDNDLVPFRAIFRTSEIVDSLSGKYAIRYVDMIKAFRHFSPKGIPGNSLFCDHLHPNPNGYRIMANEFRNAITKMNILPRIENKVYSLTPELVTGLDWEIGGLKIYKLKHSWPFGNNKVDYSLYPPIVNRETAQIAKSFLFEHHVWGKAHEEMAIYYKSSGDIKKAILEYQTILEIYPDKKRIYDDIIETAKAINAWGVVKAVSKKAVRNINSRGIYYYHLALAERMTGNLDGAIKAIEKAISAPEISHNQKANFYLTYAKLLIDNRKIVEAKGILDNLIQTYPEFTPAAELLTKLQ